MHERWSLALAAPIDPVGQGLVGGDRVAAVDFFDAEVGEIAHQLGNRSTGGLYLDRHGDGVLVVFDKEEHRQLEITGGIQRLPPFAFTRSAVAGGAVHDLVAVDPLLLEIVDSAIAQPRLGAAYGLEELRPGRTRLADDVQLFVTP